MRTRRTSVLSSLTLVAAFFVCLQAADKERTVESLRLPSGAVLSQKVPAEAGRSLIDQLNHAPELKDLSAADKVRFITKKLREQRSSERLSHNHVKRQKKQELEYSTKEQVRLKSREP